MESNALEYGKESNFDQNAGDSHSETTEIEDNGSFYNQVVRLESCQSDPNRQSELFDDFLSALEELLKDHSNLQQVCESGVLIEYSYKLYSNNII